MLHFLEGNGKGISEEVMVVGQASLTQGLRSRTAPGHPNARCGLVSQLYATQRELFGFSATWFIASVIKL